MKSSPARVDLGFIHSFRAGAKPGGATLVLLHGTGGSENDLLDIGGSLCDDAALLSPRGKAMEGDRARFFRRLAEGVFDLEDLRLRTEELAGFIERAVLHYGLASSRLLAVGYSNGANMAASLALLRPGLLAAAVLFRAMVPMVPDDLPDLSGLPVFLSAGRHDEMITSHETRRLAGLLEKSGADVSLVWQPAGHRLTSDDVAAARDWLRTL